jgi:hypothetical protein
MELVLPVYPHASNFRPVLDDKPKTLDYGKRIVEVNTTSSGALKKLFHFKELQSDPAN